MPVLRPVNRRDLGLRARSPEAIRAASDVKALEELGLLERVDGKLVAPFDEIDIKVALKDAA